jgi:hypothetical protein
MVKQLKLDFKEKEQCCGNCIYFDTISLYCDYAKLMMAKEFGWQCIKHKYKKLN